MVLCRFISAVVTIFQSWVVFEAFDYHPSDCRACWKTSDARPAPSGAIWSRCHHVLVWWPMEAYGPLRYFRALQFIVQYITKVLYFTPRRRRGQGKKAAKNSLTSSLDPNTSQQPRQLQYGKKDTDNKQIGYHDYSYSVIYTTNSSEIWISWKKKIIKPTT